MWQPARLVNRRGGLHATPVIVSSQMQACQHKSRGQSRRHRLTFLYSHQTLTAQLNSPLLPQVLPACLRHLDVSGNALTELHGIEQLVCLTWLDAGRNALQVSKSSPDKLAAAFSRDLTTFLTLLLQSAARLRACSQLCVLSLAQNQLTSLDGLEGMHLTMSFAECAGCTWRAFSSLSSCHHIKHAC